jgi:hypothetical protein
MKIAKNSGVLVNAGIKRVCRNLGMPVDENYKKPPPPKKYIF